MDNEMVIGKIVEILGHKIDVDKIDNSKLKKVMKARIVNDFLFKYTDGGYNVHSDSNKRWSEYNDYEDYKDHTDHKEWNPYIDYGDSHIYKDSYRPG